MYRHFLNRNDYLSIITETALNQLVRNNEDRFAQAEQAAEATICDYLTENYEIEQELNRGKYIIDYDRRITYPVGSFFYFEGKICEVIRAINGYKMPGNKIYWKISELPYDIKSPAAIRYSQMSTYQPGDVVVYCDTLYECITENGFDFSDIRIPGINAWEKADYAEWEAAPFQQWDVVLYQGKFFTLMSMESYDPFVNPMELDNWGMIADYDKTLDTYELSAHEYVVYNGEVYYPVMNPNASSPKLEENIRYNDPRNYNLKRHMVQLALYELHKLISPTNISNVRISDYDHSIAWLKDAARLKLNPQIPRKVNHEDQKPLTDWQMATFQTAYDPYNNPWHV